jgi:PhnB protein
MNILNPYLNFDGNCEEAFNFYKIVFGGEFTYFGRFGEMPPDHVKDLPESERNKVMHVSLKVGDNILMGSDIMEGYGPPFVAGTNFSLSITAPSKDAADEYFIKLSQGGEVTMPMEYTFWGDYFGMLTDKFGIGWMISFNEKK